MKTNSARASARQRSPERVSAIVTPSSSRSPSSSTTCACVDHLDRVVALDLVDEVARHRLAEVAAANQQPAARRRGRGTSPPGRPSCRRRRSRPGRRRTAAPRPAWRRSRRRHLRTPRAAGRRGGDTGPRWRSITVRPVAISPFDSWISCLPGSLVSATACGGHVQSRPELRPPGPCPLGQLAAGDPGREAEIVLDPGRRAGLTAGGDRVDPLDVEALRGRVEGGGEPGGPGADDHARHTAAGGGPAEPRPIALPELGVARIPQDLRRPPVTTTGVSSGLTAKALRSASASSSPRGRSTGRACGCARGTRAGGGSRVRNASR